ncbi:MAG: hypothetical protein II980_06035, partial [Clostridia bacterium]|nr:hypothetical protein [Clostridia bacterium]
MEIFESASAYVIPFVLLCVALVVLLGKRDYFSSFLDGALSGAKSSVKLLPTMCALIVGVSMLSASGASSFLAKVFAPVLELLGVPAELFTLIITRPLSGSASIAAFTELLSTLGPDSFGALCASVILASSDTVVYVICVYFSGSGIKKKRYAQPDALFVSIFFVFISCILFK